MFTNMNIILTHHVDPPHEPKGWYSVYNDDTTVKVIKDFTKKLQK